MFRFLELELHGWDFWQPLRIPLDANVVVLSGLNGAGKTTMLDAIRQILHAPRLSQNRRIAHYLRRPNEPALLRAVVSNRADHRGRRPFERQKVLTDEATLACALVANGGPPEKRFAVLPGRIGAHELQEHLLNSREWLGPDQYRRVLENAGVSRSLMHILALEQGRADELSRQEPRKLFKWIMEARGTQQVLERYTAARRQYEDSAREVDRQTVQVRRYQMELSELERKVRRLDDHAEKKAGVTAAEEIRTAVPLQDHLAELRDIERKLPQVRTKSASLVTTTDRLQREIEEQSSGLVRLRTDLQSQAEISLKAREECDAAIAEHARIAAEVERLQRASAELAGIPAEDKTHIETELANAREEQFRAEEFRRDRTALLETTATLISDLEKGTRRYPQEIHRTLDALQTAGIAAFLISERVEVPDQDWTVAIESALGNLRYALCVDAAVEAKASSIAHSHGFLGPIVANSVLADMSNSGPLHFTEPVPRWLVEWARDMRLCNVGDISAGESGLAQDGTRRDEYGIWVSQAADRVLGGGAIRHQLEQAQQDHVRIGQELISAESRACSAAKRVRDVESILEKQRRRDELLKELVSLPDLERDITSALASREERKRVRDDAAQAVSAAERSVFNAEVLLKETTDELEVRTNELNGTRTAVSEMEQKTAALEPEISRLKSVLKPELIRQAEEDQLPSLLKADKDLERARNALIAFEGEGEIPNETVREERVVLRRNLEDLMKHVQDRQREADAAQRELDSCRNEYLNVIRSTLNDYSKRARGLAEMASAKLEIELPDLRNDDKSLDEAGIVVRIGFDGKQPTELSDAGHSGGQQVIAGLILLMSMAETEGDNFFIVDEPFAHLSLDRVDDVGKFLRRCGAQFLITVPTTLDRGQLDPASLLVVLAKKPPHEAYAPRPIVARA